MFAECDSLRNDVMVLYLGVFGDPVSEDIKDPHGGGGGDDRLLTRPLPERGATTFTPD